MGENITLIRKFKRYRNLSVLGYVVSLILLCLGWYAVIWELGYYEDSERLFRCSMIAFYFILAVLSVFFLYASTAIKAQISKILLNESDPEKFFQVYFSVFRANKKSVLTWQASVAYLTGNFDGCLQYCEKIEKLNKPKLLYYPATNRARTAAMTGDKEMLAAETEKMVRYSAFLKRKREKEDAAKITGQLHMLSDLLNGNMEEAKMRADSLKAASECPMSEALCAYYRGLVYKQSGETVKAIHCFMTASEKGGKMFVKEKSDENLKELTEQP